MIRLDSHYAKIIEPESINESDKSALKKCMDWFISTFKISPNSVTADKTYYSKENLSCFPVDNSIENGMDFPVNVVRVKNQSEELMKKLYNRKAMSESVINGLKMSRSKSDRGTVLSAIMSGIGYNLKQLKNDLCH